MRNSNVKIFTTFTYVLLLLLILSSVAYLIAQKIQLSKQAEAYTNQIIERISSSYIENGNFTAPNFVNDVKKTMQSFSDIINVITIVGSDNIMLNRFRFDSANPYKDPNPNWQDNLHYQYNPLLYEERNHDLQLPGQTNTSVKILYQRLPTQLIKNVLQFDTVVILALLILSFLAFLIIPKREASETAWALKAVAEEDELYHGETVSHGKQLLDNNDDWYSHDLPENSWDEDDSESVEIDAGATGIDPWETSEDGNDVGESSEDSNIGDFTSLKAPDFDENEDVDLSFNNRIADSQDDEDDTDSLVKDSYFDNDDDIDLSEEPADLPDSLDSIRTRPLDSADDISSPSENETEGTDELDSLLTEAIEELELQHDDEFVAQKPEPITESASVDLMEEFPSFEELDLSDELVDDLDEGLGDDELEFIDQDLNPNIFSQIAAAASIENDIPIVLAPETSQSGPISEQDSPDASTSQSESTSEQDSQDSGSELETEYQQEILGWLKNFLEDQQINGSVTGEENPTPDLSVALLEAPPENIAAVRASLEENLNLEASTLSHDKNLTVFLPINNIQEGIERIQNAVGQLPGSYLKGLKMGITGVSAARNDMEPVTILAEMKYALANCDEVNNISIFDADDQIFNQQHNNS